MEKKLNSLVQDLKQNEPNVTCTSATVTRSNKVSESASDKLYYSKVMEGTEELTGVKFTRKIFENLHAVNLHGFYMKLIYDYLFVKNADSPVIAGKRYERFCNDTENGTKLIEKDGNKKPFALVSDTLCSQMIAAWSDFDTETRQEMKKEKEQRIKEIEERREKERRIKDIREKVDMYTATKMNKEQIYTVLSSFGYTYKEINEALQK